VLAGLRAAEVDDVPVIVGGIIPDADERKLLSLGVAAVFTPKDYGLTEMMAKMVDQIRISRGLPPL
jgi:ethylmalonyl-CoA mutase